MMKPPEAGAEPLSADQFYDEWIKSNPLSIHNPARFKVVEFAEAYAAHVSQAYERRIAHQDDYFVQTAIEKVDLKERAETAERQLAEARAAIWWALGENGEFAERGEGGPYWFRIELRERARKAMEGKV